MQGHTDALELLGHTTKPKLSVSSIAVNRDSVQIGQELSFSLTLTARHDEKLMIDYVGGVLKASGKTKPKVFKLKKEKVCLFLKKHRLLADTTTFSLYLGIHTSSYR